MLAQKLIVTFLSRFIVQIIQILASIIVARIAGAEVFGTIAFGLAYVTMFSTIADMGFGTSHMKLLSEGKDVQSCLGTFIRIKISLIIAYVLVVIGFFCLQKFVFHVDFEDEKHIIVIFIFLTSMSINELFAVPRTTFSAFTQVAKTNLPDFIQTLFYQIFRIVIVLLGYRVIALAIGYLLSTIIIIPVFWYLFREYKIGEFDRELAKKYIKYALPVILIGFTSKLTITMDKVLLQFFTNSEMVGYYSAGFKIGGFVLLIGASVSNLFFPTFSKSFSENDTISIRNKLQSFERFAFLYIMPFIIIITLNSDVIVKVLLGNKYLSSVSIMKMINFAMFLMVINTPFGTVITGKGKFKTVAKINVFIFLIYFLALIILVNPSILGLKGLGAATALMLSYLFLGIVYRYFASKYVKNLNHFVSVKFFIYGIVNYFVFDWLLNLNIIDSVIVWHIVHSIIFIIITYLSLFLTGMMKKEDLHQLHILINFKEVTHYLTGEIKK